MGPGKQQGRTTRRQGRREAARRPAAILVRVPVRVVRPEPPEAA